MQPIIRAWMTRDYIYYWQGAFSVFLPSSMNYVHGLDHVLSKEMTFQGGVCVVVVSAIYSHHVKFEVMERDVKSTRREFRDSILFSLNNINDQ